MTANLLPPRYTKADVGFPLGNRTVHYVADGIPLSIATAFRNGAPCGATVYFWDDPSRCWIWTHQTWEEYPIPGKDLHLIASHVVQSFFPATK